MLIRRFYAARTVVIIIGVASVEGRKPLIGIAEEVEKAWKKLKLKFGIKERRQRLVQRTVSNSELDKTGKMDRMRFRRGSQEAMNKFHQLDTRRQEEDYDTNDVYSPFWKPPKFDKNDPNYGRPKPGSLTEKRGIDAGHHIGKEIIQLCEVITEYGHETLDGSFMISFGQLFDLYVYISDKVVGMLMRARKHKLLDFEGEMLYQRRDEGKIIVLLKSLEEIRQLYAQSDDPARCLMGY